MRSTECPSSFSVKSFKLVTHFSVHRIATIFHIIADCHSCQSIDQQCQSAEDNRYIYKKMTGTT